MDLWVSVNDLVSLIAKQKIKVSPVINNPVPELVKVIWSKGNWLLNPDYADGVMAAKLSGVTRIKVSIYVDTENPTIN